VGVLLLWEVIRRPLWRVSSVGAAALLVAGAAAYTRAPYRRLWPQARHLGPARLAYTLALVPLIRVIGDVAKMAGYPAGLLRRARLRGPGG
jgi:hypothetical protein